jgi:hypothetical protein
VRFSFTAQGEVGRAGIKNGGFYRIRRMLRMLEQNPLGLRRESLDARAPKVPFLLSLN